MTLHCNSCGADVVRDHVRKRFIEEDGTAHHCPSPEIPDLRECICGVIVSVYADGRRVNFKTGEPHSHEGVIETKTAIGTPKTSTPNAAPALWESYRQ